MPASRKFIESRSAGGDYNENEFDDGGYYAEVPRQYALAFDVTPKLDRGNRTAWTWLGGLLAFVAGFIALALIAAAPTSGPMPVADALAVLSACMIAFFGLIGMI